MQVNVAGIRRNIKNLAHNYSDAQVKVREATSNDPWGPSATIMAEIADLTYNVVAFSEIMQMIWKRLNDHGKNWRHVYKALILLEYLIKTGTEKVAQQCKENIFAIQTLREFVYFEENKDQGTHVREKARQLVTLLKDDERLKNERAKALKAKERFAQHASGFGSDGYVEGPTHRETPTSWAETETKPTSDIEFVRPQTAGEEELQLQLAMAMSREEAEQEEAKRRSDDVRLQLALSQSEQDFKKNTKRAEQEQPQQSHLMDLLDISLGAASISSNALGVRANGGLDPWVPPGRAVSQLSDPWSGASSPQAEPWPSNSLNASKPTNSSNLDNWLTSNPTQRTQSPSVTSNSSTEGWLQSNVVSGNGTLNGHSNLNPDPWLHKTSPKTNNKTMPDPWLLKANSVEKPEDPWQLKIDPWAPPISEKRHSPLGAMTSPTSDMDDFDVISNRNKAGQENNFNSGNNNNSIFKILSLLDEMDPLTGKKILKTPQSFLGENSSLVNLDNLIKPVSSNSAGIGHAYNPFNDSSTSIISQQGITIPAKNNLFQQQMPSVPSINQLKQQQSFPVSLNQDPWTPNNSSSSTAQYLSAYHYITPTHPYFSNCNSNSNVIKIL
ncbi:epsin-2 isoform X3 [Condylostylus longicornis]|nr:epsin-2 isoform X3 [Condylostylus longicornis]XP_055384207.1 epsin-2 isoform X3 [Condylostylus longicornis]